MKNNSTSNTENGKITASGVKRKKQPKSKRNGGERKVERPISAIGMTVSPSLLAGKAIIVKRERPSKDQTINRAEQRRNAEKSASGVASRGMASTQRVRPIIQTQQPIASGVKRGRKRNVIIEQRGWGIYNKKTSYLIDEFFRRKTDAISHLERDQKKPWSAIKHQNELKPVPVKIIIMDKEIINLAKSRQ